MKPTFHLNSIRSSIQGLSTVQLSSFIQNEVFPHIPVTNIPFCQSIFSHNQSYFIHPHFFKPSLTSCSLRFPFQIPALHSSLIPGDLLTCPNHRNQIASITSIRKSADSIKTLVAFYETARCNRPLNSYRLGLGCWIRLVYLFKAYWFRAPTGLTLKNDTFCPHCIYVFCIYLRTNSDLCYLQHKLIGFYNRDEKCLQRGTDWVFK